MSLGRVILSHGQLYQVQLGQQVLECRSRGKFRLADERVLVGDWVEVTPTGPGEGRIDRVRPRTTVLQRPPVANANQAVVVFTLVEPEADLRFLDRVLVHVEQAGIPVVIALNKVDLLTPAAVAAFTALYGERVGYPVLPISAATGAGVDRLVPILAGQISVLAGQSGVGKSRLVRALSPDREQVQVGALSRRLLRGRHTTRHVELVPLADGGLLADTPGFTGLTFQGVDADQLTYLFVDFPPHMAGCEFNNCRHGTEPVCGIKAAVGDGRIAPHRYEHYRFFLSEIEAQRPW